MSPLPEGARTDAEAEEVLVLNDPLAALERGDWRAAYALVADLSRGATESAVGAADLLAAVRMVARSMLMQTHGQVGKSWDALAQAAASCTPARPGIERLTPVSPIRLFLPPPAGTDRHWGRLTRIGHREEEGVRGQRNRLLAAAAQVTQTTQDGADRLTVEQLALIEGVIDHLTWVDCDPCTWQAPVRDERVTPSENLTRNGLGDHGRNYFLRRAKVLYQEAFPREGGVSRTVWDQMGGYRPVRGRALEELALRAHSPQLDGLPYRFGYSKALADATLWFNYMKGGRME